MTQRYKCRECTGRSGELCEFTVHYEHYESDIACPMCGQDHMLVEVDQ